MSESHERRILKNEDTEVEGHRKAPNLTEEQGGDEAERRPNPLTDDEPEVEGHRKGPN
jgi:hypothetical protein